MRATARSFALLAALLAALLLPGAAHAAPPARADLAGAATQLTLRYDPARAQGGRRAPIIARLVDAAGAPVAGARVAFLVDGQRDGEAQTDRAGTALWRIRRELPAGAHTVAGQFTGTDLLAAASASVRLRVAPATVELSAAPAAVGQPITIVARLAGAAGAPVAGARIALTVNGVRQSELRTDDSGAATRRLAGSLPAGTYALEAEFEGLPDLLPARAAAQALVTPAAVEVQTVPALPGARFAIDGRPFVAGADGVARTTVERAGEYTLSALAWDGDASGLRATFDRWADPVFAATRKVKLPARAPLVAGFNVSYLVGQEFVDAAGRPVDPARITAIELTSSYGTRLSFDQVQPRWLPGIHVVRLKGGLSASPISYALDSVVVDGSNVVNRAQLRFASSMGERWQIPLQLHSARFVARDALFGFPIGTTIHLTYPDGQTRALALGQGGDVRLAALARGAYTVRVDAPGIAGPTPAALTRDQEIVLLVLSYLDLAVFGLFMLAIAGGLLLVGRPALARLARDPLAPLRRGADGQIPARVWLIALPAAVRGAATGAWAAARSGRWRRAATRDAAAPARPRRRLPRWIFDPAIMLACGLVALGTLGAGLARSVAASVPAPVASPTLAARAPEPPASPPPALEPAVAALAEPTAAPAIAPTAAPELPHARLTFKQTLERKSSGPAVEQLQQRLRELGYFRYPENTGYFGTDTARAVARFQAARGLEVTGAADLSTIAELNRCGQDCLASATPAEVGQ